MPNSRKPQLTNPVKLSKPELHEKRLSLGRWHLEKEIKENLKNSFFLLFRMPYYTYYCTRYSVIDGITEKKVILYGIKSKKRRIKFVRVRLRFREKRF